MTRFHLASAEPLDLSTLAGCWWGYSFRLAPVWDDSWVPGWSPYGKCGCSIEVDCEALSAGWPAQTRR